MHEQERKHCKENTDCRRHRQTFRRRILKQEQFEDLSWMTQEREIECVTILHQCLVRKRKKTPAHEHGVDARKTQVVEKRFEARNTLPRLWIQNVDWDGHKFETCPGRFGKHFGFKIVTFSLEPQLIKIPNRIGAEAALAIVNGLTGLDLEPEIRER